MITLIHIQLRIRNLIASVSYKSKKKAGVFSFHYSSVEHCDIITLGELMTELVLSPRLEDPSPLMTCQAFPLCD